MLSTLISCSVSDENPENVENNKIPLSETGKTDVSFELIESYSVDTSGIRKRFRIVDGTLFTYFIQFSDLKQMKTRLPRDFDVELSDFKFDSTDYEDKFLAVTFGRKIVDFQYEYPDLGDQAPPDYAKKAYMARAYMTFSEEYQEQSMYLYVMDKISFVYIDSDVNELYVMNGSERIYLGESMLNINQRYPSDRPGV